MPMLEHAPQNSAQNRGVYISTYGCQMNVNDSERLYTLLEMIDYVPVATPEQASLIIINSCSVREKPVHKVHSEVGRYRRLKDKNPDLKLGIGGCVAQQEKNKLLKDLPLVDFVFGTDAIDEVPQIVRKLEAVQKSRELSVQFRHKEPYHVETLVRNPGVSTFVNITKGCDNFCSFCVVPFTRGREKSRPLTHLLEDTQRLVERGVKEITLLGQNVNSYQSDCGANFAKLLQTLAEKTSIERIRFTTSHPKDFDQELVDVMQANRKKVCDYIHLPVQSGNSEVLERMNRGYTREDYLQKVEMIVTGLPGVCLSTDMIVGFPGETDEQFADTLSLIREVPYESLFAFAYSPRPFTKASRFPDQLSEEVKSERLNTLISEHREIAFRLASRYKGQRLEVLVEQKDGESEWTGRSTQNKLVHFTGGENLIGKTVAVDILEAKPQVLKGEYRQ